VPCSCIKLTAALAAICSLLQVAVATLAVPPSLIEEAKGGKPQALIEFLRLQEPGCLNNSQLIYDLTKDRLSKFDKNSTKNNTVFAEEYRILIDLERLSMSKTVTASQKSIDKQVAMFNSCESDGEIKKEPAEKLKKIYQDSSSAHKACTKNEYKQFRTTSACADIMESQTKLHAGSSKQLRAMSLATKKDCARAYNESDFAYATRMRNKFVTDYSKFLELKEKHSKIVKGLEETKKTCTEVDKDYQSVKEDCDATAELMDSSACKYAFHMKEACNHFADCGPMYYGSWEAAKKSAEELVKGIPEHWELTSKTVCLLGLLTKEKVEKIDIDNCDNCKSGHCDELDFDYLESKFPPESECKVPKVFPCNKAYYVKEYGHLPKGVERECLPCEGISLATKGNATKGNATKKAK